MIDIIQNTDPLALTALGGLVIVLLVTAALFAFIMTRSDGNSRTGRS